MEDEFKITIHPTLVSFLLLIPSMSYCFHIVKRVPKGIPRIFSLLPIFYFFSLLPWHFSSALLRGVAAFFIPWIASFKLLLFSFNKGPLTKCRNLTDFVAVAVFPVKVREEKHPPTQTLDSETLLKVIGMVSLVLLLNTFINSKEEHPRDFTLFLLGVSIFLGFHTLLTRESYLVQAMASYEPVRIFNQPYLAKSLQDLWGRRWNRLSSDIFRLSVYDPIREALTGVVGVRKAKVGAMVATMCVSGIMHEVLFYYITCGKRPTWEVTCFFLLHGLCMVLEARFRVIGWDPFHPVVKVLLTVGFTVVTAYWLLVLPVWRDAGCSS